MSEAQREAVRQCLYSIKEAAQAASNEHKDMHATISKLGKAIDKVWGTINQTPAIIHYLVLIRTLVRTSLL